MKTEKVKYCTDLLFRLGRDEKKELLEKSNLNDREIEVMEMRYLKGMTVAEISEELFISEKGYEHLQRRILEKLFSWLIGEDEGRFREF